MSHLFCFLDKYWFVKVLFYFFSPPLHALVLAKWKLIYFLFWLMFINITHPVLWENTRLSASALCRASSRAMFLLWFEWLNHNLPRTASVGLVTFIGGSDTVGSTDALALKLNMQAGRSRFQVKEITRAWLSGIYVRANTHTHAHLCIIFSWMWHRCQCTIN